MNEGRIKEIIDKARKSFKPEIDEKKGMRFYDDNRVLRNLRMNYFAEKNLPKLPTMKEFLSSIDEDWLLKNVDRSVKTIAEIDYHYESKEKWY